MITVYLFFFFFKQKTAYEMRISDWSSDVCSSDLAMFVADGSEAAEAAIKLARQYHVERGEPSRHRVIARRQSYHGNTLGALSAGGNVARRALYQPYLLDWSHIAPCRSEEHTSELQSLMRISYAVFCLKKKTIYIYNT